jgi:small-conductance mechanosensitive channel
MTILSGKWPEFTWAGGLRLAGIFVAAFILIRLMKMITRWLVKPAASQGRVALMREEQTRRLAGVLNTVGITMILAAAVLTALDILGINATPLAALVGLASVALGFGAQNTIRDIISGFLIAFENQYVVGDSIQIGDTVGRVEHLTLRRTVLRDAQGAMVTVSNGEIRKVANLSREWSQIFVDVSVGPDAPMEIALALLEKVAGDFRADATWSPALVDGPRVLGVQSLDRECSTVRMQVRTLPMRQDDVARELRRRVQNQFAQKRIPLTALRRVEWTTAEVSEAGPGFASNTRQGGVPWDK